MKMQSQVCSLQQSKKLLQLGVSQEDAHFMWFEVSNGDDEGDFEKEAVEWHPILTQQNYVEGEHQAIDPIDSELTTSDGEFCSCKPDSCKAFTVAELGVMLPSRALTGENVGGVTFGVWKGKTGFRFRKHDELDCSIQMTEASARAGLLISLLEGGHLTIDECNDALKKSK